MLTHTCPLCVRYVLVVEKIELMYYYYSLQENIVMSNMHAVILILTTCKGKLVNKTYGMYSTLHGMADSVCSGEPV